MSTTVPQFEVFTAAQVAKILNCSRITVDRMVDAGKLTGYKLPGVKGRRIQREVLLAFLEKNGIAVEVIPMPPVVDWKKLTAKTQPDVAAGADGTDVAQVSLRDFFRAQYWPRKTRGRSAGNCRLYEISLNNFKKFLGREGTLGDLDDDVIVAWTHWHIDHGRAASTANRNLAEVLALWRFAAKRRYVAQFPTVELLCEPKRTPQAWNADQVRAIFAAAANVKGMLGDFQASTWWLALMQVLWWSCERIGSIMQLKWSDIDLDGGFVCFRAETRKGGTSDMRHKLPAEAVALLSQLRRESDDLVFPWPRHARQLWPHYTAIRRRAGLPAGRRDKCHRIRRTVASFLTAAGGNATLALGHSSTQITQQHYLDPFISGVRGPAELLFSPAGKGGAG
jgi:excisionase family DNA binding protein